MRTVSPEAEAALERLAAKFWAPIEARLLEILEREDVGKEMLLCLTPPNRKWTKLEAEEAREA
jgi:hypothetical protein